MLFLVVFVTNNSLASSTSLAISYIYLDIIFEEIDIIVSDKARPVNLKF